MDDSKYINLLLFTIIYPYSTKMCQMEITCVQNLTP